MFSTLRQRQSIRFSRLPVHRLTLSVGYRNSPITTKRTKNTTLGKSIAISFFLPSWTSSASWWKTISALRRAASND